MCVLHHAHLRFSCNCAVWIAKVLLQVDLLKQKTTLEDRIDEMATERFHPLLLENQQEVHVDGQ